jgi:AbrB family looped-hinge helix DNA binding protein
VPTATLTAKGQLTLPKAIRDLLKVDRGDRLEFLVNEDGIVTLFPVTADVTDLKGMILPSSQKPVTVEEMNEAIAELGSRR